MKWMEWLTIAILFSACSGKNNVQTLREVTESAKLDTVVAYPVTVRLQEAIERVDEDACLSRFVESIEYIPLKLGKTILKDESIYYSAYDETAGRFFLSDLYQVIGINRNGEHPVKIGKRGQGPGEYTQVGAMSIVSSSKSVYIYDARTHNMTQFGYDGELKGMHPRFGMQMSKSNPIYCDGYFFARGSSYYGGGRIPLDKFVGLCVLDTLGNYVEVASHSVHKLKDLNRDTWQPICPFPISIYKNRILLAEHMDVIDTLFTFESGCLTPRYVLDYGVHKPDLDKLWTLDRKMANQEISRSITTAVDNYSVPLETSRYFFIKCQWKGNPYIVVYDKYEKSHYSFSYHVEDHFGGGAKWNAAVFRNDIDGGLDQDWGKFSVQGNYSFHVIPAYVLKEKLTDEHFASRQDVLDKAGQERLKALVESLDEEDDPVIMLMKLKEEMK